MRLDLAKFRARFVEEARDHLERITQGLLTLEKQPDDRETLDTVFRAAHSIKGTARVLKLKQISQLAHKVEDVLDALRSQQIVASKPLSDVLFQSVDLISLLVDESQSEKEDSRDIEPLCRTLEEHAAGVVVVQGVSPAAEPSAESPPAIVVVADAISGGTTSGETTSEAATSKAATVPPAAAPDALPASAPATKASSVVDKTPRRSKPKSTTKLTGTIRLDPDKLDSLIGLAGEIDSSQLRIQQHLLDLKKLGKMVRHVAVQAGVDQDQGPGRLSSTELSIAEETESLPRLTKNLHQHIKRLTSRFVDETAHLELMTEQLREDALRMRMQPLSRVFDPLRLTVRDVSQVMGKEVQFEILGGDTAMDKKIIEQMGDPLNHMVRNAIDHGIETVEERLKAGKSKQGLLQLSAFYEGGGIHIELRDDGAGLNIEEIRQQAVQKGIATLEELESWSDTRIIYLIFSPGFSTGQFITDVSGRGVGMDVVHKNIVDTLRGTIHVETTEGQGTCFQIRLPLSLAVMRILLVEVANTPYAIPMDATREVVQVRASDLIDVVSGRAVRHRDQIIPVAPLSRLLQLEEVEEASGHTLQLIVIVAIGKEQLGLVIDALLDEGNRVIKSLPKMIGQNSWTSGAIISNQGDPVNVLDLSRVCQRFEHRQALAQNSRGQSSGNREEEGGGQLLVVDDSVNTRDIERTILESYGYQVDVAGDGQEAWEKLQSGRYDLIVTDVEMPRMDGFTLTEKVRGFDKTRETPVIIVTSREKEADKRRGMLVGANAYIVKGGFDQNNLLETVRSLMGDG